MWPVDGSVEEKWSALPSLLVEMGEELLGKSRRRNADWFQESKDELKPALYV